MLMSIVEPPAFTIKYSDYNGSYSRDVSWKSLREGKVGDIFIVCGIYTCERNVSDEKAKIVYKDNDGVAVLFTVRRTADTPEVKELETESRLCWFQFNNQLV